MPKFYQTSKGSPLRRPDREYDLFIQVSRMPQFHFGSVVTMKGKILGRIGPRLFIIQISLEAGEVF